MLTDLAYNLVTCVLTRYLKDQQKEQLHTCEYTCQPEQPASIASLRELPVPSTCSQQAPSHPAWPQPQPLPSSLTLVQLKPSQKWQECLEQEQQQAHRMATQCGSGGSFRGQAGGQEWACFPFTMCPVKTLPAGSSASPKLSHAHWHRHKKGFS